MVQHLARHWRNVQKNKNGTKNNVEPAKEESDQTPNLPRWYAKMQCEICNKFFSDCKSLKKHIQCVHKKIKPFICNVCGHSTGRKHMMQLHMRQHTGEKPFVCNHCDYRTGDHNTLRKHIMRHTGERPYKCVHCTYSSIQSAPLKLHVKTVHGKKTAM